MVAFDLPVFEYFDVPVWLAEDIEQFSLIIEELLTDEYVYKASSIDSMMYAQRWDYKTQALRIWEEINEIISNRFSGDARLCGEGCL